MMSRLFWIIHPLVLSGRGMRRDSHGVIGLRRRHPSRRTGGLDDREIGSPGIQVTIRAGSFGGILSSLFI